MIPIAFGQYDVINHLGSGGMADVYLGKHRLHLREDAIKVPRRDQLNDEVRRRFLQEARIAAGFDHEAIVHVLDVGQEGDVPYMVMRYMRGGSLADRLKSGPYTLEQALPVLERIAAALDYVHSRGPIHRDVKPGNILFDGKGQAYLSDFGIARVYTPEGDETAVRQTAPGVAHATFAYASPEQVQAVSDLDSRSDLYSLGVVAFEMLSGDVPYKADSGVQLSIMHVVADIPSINQRRPDLPPALQDVMNCALAKQRGQRYQTGAALVEDLRLIAAGQPPRHAPRATPQERPNRLLPLLALVVVLIGLGAGARWWLGQDDAPGVTAPNQTTSTLNTAETRATPAAPTPTAAPPTPSPTGEAAAEQDKTPSASPLVVSKEGDAVVFQSNRDGDYDIYILDLAGGEPTALTDNDAADNFPRVSPDGQRIVFVSERDGNQEIYLMNRDGGGQTRLTDDPARDDLPAWSPNGRQIVFVSSRDGLADLFVMDADGANVRQVTDTLLREGHVSWSPDGQLAYNASDELYWQLYVADADGGNSRRITRSTYDEWSPEWSPDGQSLLFHSERDSRTNPGIYLMRADGSEARQLYNAEGEEWGATWSPDGTEIIFAADQPDGTADLFIMNADGSDARRLLERGGYPSWARALDTAAPASARQSLTGDGVIQLTFGEKDHYTAALSADQSFLLVAVELGDTWHIFEADPNGSGLRRQITHGDNYYVHPELLPGGEQFLVAAALDGETDIYLINRVDGEVVARLTDDPAKDYAPRALPNGSGFVFTSERDGDAEIYRATFDGQETQLTHNDVFDGIPTVSADGQWIAFQSGRDGDYEIYVMTTDGKQPRRLTISAGRDADPAFTPDGQWVVFESERSGNYEIHAIPFAGGETRQLTDSPGGNWFPSLSPDGHWLLFQSDRDGYMDIYRQPWSVGEATTEGVAVATPPAACRYTIDRRWAALDDDMAERLGCPTGPAVADNGAFQYYERAVLVWREDPDLVYVLYGSGAMAVYPSTGPKNYYAGDLRKGAFGYLWDNNQTVREGAGQPQAIEMAAGGFTVQTFEHGTLLYFDDSNGQYYVLFDDGTWIPLR